MKRILYLVLLLFVVSCVNRGNQESKHSSHPKKSYEAFYSYLDQDKTDALIQAVDVFNNFLDDNYGDQATKASKAKAFLGYLAEKIEQVPDSSWIFDTRKNALVVELFEETGLRKEIWLYGREEQQFLKSEALEQFLNYQDSISELRETIIKEIEDIPIQIPTTNDSLRNIQLYEDSIKYLNHKTVPVYNSLLYVMLNNPTNNSCIQKYIDFRFYEGQEGAGSLIREFLKCESECYSDLYFDVIIVSEVFYFYMYAYMD
jgi:hypothetical protein